jgi:thiamine biosynthesis lipoprotein
MLLSPLRHLSIVLIVAMLGSTLPARAEQGEPLRKYVYERAEMGLPFRVSMYASSESAARASADAAFEKIAQLNATFSDYDSDTEVSRLSRLSGQGKAVPVSSILWKVLTQAQALAVDTGGAFDVTVGPLVNTWRRARRKRELPSEELIAEMKARVGFEHVRLNEQAQTVELLRPEMRLDFGAIVKGVAIDEALDVVKNRGITRVLISGGGDMAAGDPPPGQPGWRIEIAALDAPSAPPAQVLLLANRAMATSGDIFQHVEIDGKRYSHIVDPRTGVGLTDHSLVTVVASDCATADALATAVSVLGPDAGLKLIERKDNVEAKITRAPDGTVQHVESKGWNTLPLLK